MSNRITERLKIEIEYRPNDNEEEFELNVTVNDSEGQSIVPFATVNPKDMTLNEIFKEAKDIVKEILGF